MIGRRYPQGGALGIGVIIGIILGIILAFTLGDFIFVPIITIIIAAAIGYALQASYYKRPVPMNRQQQKARVSIVLVVFCIILISLIFLYW